MASDVVYVHGPVGAFSLPLRVLRWEAPPPSRARNDTSRSSRTSRWDRIADELRDRRGEWGVVMEQPKGAFKGALAAHIRQGSLLAFAPAGDFDACTRILADGRRAVYARYLGDGGGE